MATQTATLTLSSIKILSAGETDAEWRLNIGVEVGGKSYNIPWNADGVSAGDIYSLGNSWTFPNENSLEKYTIHVDGTEEDGPFDADDHIPGGSVAGATEGAGVIEPPSHLSTEEFNWSLSYYFEVNELEEEDISAGPTPPPAPEPLTITVDPNHPTWTSQYAAEFTIDKPPSFFADAVADAIS